MKARVKASLPADCGVVHTCEWQVEGGSIYDCVDSVKGMRTDYVERWVKKAYALSELINIHNIDGVNVERTLQMKDRIVSGGDIFDESGLPNVKAVPTESGEFLLFDGHHTVLAYMLAGRYSLHEVPHLTVEDADAVHPSAGEISAFYGRHAEESQGLWRDYVINWMNPVDKQLCGRIQEKMGQLHAHIMESLAKR